MPSWTISEKWHNNIAYAPGPWIAPPGTARHDPLAYLQKRSVDWPDHQLAARELLSINAAETYLVVEHECPKSCLQDKTKAGADPGRFARRCQGDRRSCSGHVRFAARSAAAQNIPAQGFGREPYRS